MNRFISFCAILLIVSPAVIKANPARKSIPANHKHIEYSGRIDFSDPLAPAFSFSGVSIRARFTGTSISAILSDETGQNHYNVILNGEVIDVLKLDKEKKEYVLADNLADRTHEIELFKRTELSFGKTRFYGFALDKKKSLKACKERELLIEYIGNSITCGYGNEGSADDDFLATNENHYLSYAAITSRNLNARHMAVSRSGMGVYRNYNGPIEGNADCMSNLYPNTFLYDDQPKYDFKVQPDLVCINLGTNDFSTSGADTVLYISNYLRLIDTIQSKYDQSEILCLLGPMMSGENLARVRSCLQYIVETANGNANGKRNGNGKGKVSLFEMSTQGDLGYAVHYHPTIAQHYKNAGELTKHIGDLLDRPYTIEQQAKE